MIVNVQKSNCDTVISKYVFPFSAPFQCIGIPISFLSLAYSSSKMFYSQRLGRFADVDPGFKNVLPIFPIVAFQVLISPTFYEQLFYNKVFCIAILYLQFVFVIFWQKQLAEKAARKMLVKLPSRSPAPSFHWCSWLSTLKLTSLFAFCSSSYSTSLPWRHLFLDGLILQIMT